MDIAIERASVTLGFLTLGVSLAVFASCRSCLFLLTRAGMKNPLASKTYQSFFSHHTLYWQAFLTLILGHLSLAIAHTGIPQAGDPDAPIHWIILSMGLAAVLTFGVILFSCRISNSLVSRSIKRIGLPVKNFQVFSGFHGYYWLTVFVIISVHFFFVHMHIGFWPGGG